MCFLSYDVAGNVFEVTSRYGNLKPLHFGASGLICTAIDSLSEKTVVIKRIVNALGGSAPSRRVCRELKVMNEIRHFNVIHLRDLFFSPSGHLYMVTELYVTDLQQLLSTNTLERRFVQYFLCQIFRGLKYLHSAGVVHRDLKPSNILLGEDCEVKICDYGFARTQTPRMTGYVSTIQYRAPEIVLNWQKYDNAVDIWSTGCIFAEMIGGVPIFPGTDHVQQLKRVIQVIGPPPIEILRDIQAENTRQFILNLSRHRKIGLEVVIPKADPSALDLLRKIFMYEPWRRITADAALCHQYTSPYHDPDAEPSAPVSLIGHF